MSAAVTSRLPSPMIGEVAHHAAVAARASERDAERAGHCRFRPAGIRRTMLACVAPHRAPRRVRIHAGQDRCGTDQKQGCQPRRRQVDQIVETRGRPAERLVFRRAVTDHGIGGVGRLVGHAARQPADRQPEGGRHDAIGEILGKAFDRRARHAGAIEAFRVAPDDSRHRVAAGRQAVVQRRARQPRHGRTGSFAPTGWWRVRRARRSPARATGAAIPAHRRSAPERRR